MQFTIARDLDTLQGTLRGIAAGGQRIALVPTMGALHDGHLTLVREAAKLADAVVVSIFVNPTQFGPNEDFAKYPRMPEDDIRKARDAGAAVIYAPSTEDMYGPNFATRISVGPMADILCGRFRPGHFDGVATVVAKLLLRALPHIALFGEKDYQQLCVIHRLVRDLDIPIEIIGVPTVRERDGLAMSSRNAYLSKEERELAPKLHAVLSATANDIAAGLAIEAAIEKGIGLLTSAGFKVDYLELRESYSLAALKDFRKPARLLVAAWLGKTRLIDNLPME